MAYRKKCKRNGCHEMINCKIKTATACNKAKGYISGLTPVKAGFDDESVASVDI